MVRFLAILRYFVGGIGLSIGFYYLGDDSLGTALKIVCLMAVGVVGLISFLTHVVYHKEDAERLGWSPDHPEWQFEVGFANFAFGVAGVIVYFATWDKIAAAILIFAYGLYLLQAAIIHTIYSFQNGKKDIKHFLKSGVVTFVYSGTMLYFAIIGMIGK